MEKKFKSATGTVCRTQVENKIYDIIAKTITSLGYVIVKIRVFKYGKKSILQIMLEKTNGEPVTISDCEKASKCISVMLDANDSMLDTSYNLEISSTGINRPLTRPEDFERFIGHKVRVKTLTKIVDSSVFLGILNKSDGQTITINNDESSIAIEVANIVDAKLDMELSSSHAELKKVANKKLKNI